MVTCAAATVPRATLVVAASPEPPAEWRWTAREPVAVLVPIAVDALVGARLLPRPVTSRDRVVAADEPIGIGGGQLVGDKRVLPTSGAVVAGC
jgi:hypothetical protein